MLLSYEESSSLKSSIQDVIRAFDNLPAIDLADQEELYNAYKNLHEVAIGPWCTLCQILQDRIEASAPLLRAANNLHSSRSNRPTTDDLLI